MDIATTYQQQLEAYGFIPANHVTPQFFPVDVGGVYDAKGEVVPGYQRVYREDSGDTLAIHTDSYKLIRYEDSFQAFDLSLKASGLDLTNMQIATDYANRGARIFRQYLLPAYQIDLGNGDLSALRIIMFNSYDGSTAFQGMAGAYRFVCANMAVIGKDIIRVKVRHVGKAVIEPVIETVVEAAKTFTDEMERQRAWGQVGVEHERAIDTFRALPQATDRLTEHLTLRWVEETRDHTKSLWTLYNVLTSWATHGGDQRAEKLSVGASIDRQKRVKALTEGKAWEQLLLAA